MRTKKTIAVLFSLIILLICGLGCGSHKHDDSIVIKADGNVGGNPNPSAELEVCGDIIFTPLEKEYKIKVSLFANDTLIVYDPELVVVFDTLGWKSN